MPHIGVLRNPGKNQRKIVEIWRYFVLMFVASIDKVLIVMAFVFCGRPNQTFSLDDAWV